MSDDATPGVLLRGADGNRFFIPHTDLSKYEVEASPDTGDELASAPRVTAFAVQKTAGVDSAVFMPMPEGSPAAFMPMPEG